ncbi:MAG: DUF2796 domain-containing protein [Gammaproteobacteria bacterium]|nr:DUF2796 domain-containing protein [Gammaproteobacteria bacterium]
MKTQRLNVLTASLILAIILPSSQASEQAIELGSHVHGLAELNIATEGKTLEIQLISPAMNLLGFEHKASSKEERAAVEHGESQLHNHEALFLLSNEQCVHTMTTVDVSDLIERTESSASDQDEHDGHDEDESESEHHHENHAEADKHSDVTATYQYRCENTTSLSSITVNVFDSFSGIHKLDVMWISTSHQGGVTLTSKNRTIKLK